MPKTYTGNTINKFSIVADFIAKAKKEDMADCEATLDSPHDEIAGNIVVPPYNKEASPETNPATADWLIACAYISAEERNKVPDEDCAGPKGSKSFPIRNGKDVKNASRLVGHSPNPSETKKRIIEIAHRKGLENHLPESWKSPDRQK